MANRDDLERIEQARAAWEAEAVDPILRRVPERRASFETVSGFPVDRLYTPADVPDLDYLRDLGFPGQYPYTRGVQPTGYRGRLWTTRQVTGFHDPAETNRRLKYLAEHGQTGLNIVFDMPTHNIMDSDHELAEGEVGKEGVPLDSLADVEILFDGIDLAQVSTSLITNSAAAPVLSLYLALARKRGVPFDRLQGTTQNDPLLSFHSSLFFVIPIAGAMRLYADTVEYCARQVPRWNHTSIAGYNIREGGTSAVQEIAFSLAEGIAYVEACCARGLAVDEFAPRISFFFNAHNDFFEEIAKYRAARRLWATIMRERFGAKDPRSWMLRFHTQTAGSTLTQEQPLNNIIRTTVQALAAVLGGTQSLHTNSYDEALSLPTEESVRVAMRTQQILANESGVASTMDPLGGSFFIEALTNRLESEARALIERIDAEGGMVAATQSGWVIREKQQYFEQYYRQIESGDRVVVGVNGYQTEEDLPIRLFKIDPTFEEKQKEAVRGVRASRDQAAAEQALARLRDDLTNGRNSIEATIDAALAYATLGEIAGVYRQVFGESRERMDYAALV